MSTFSIFLSDGHLHPERTPLKLAKLLGEHTLRSSPTSLVRVVVVAVISLELTSVVARHGCRGGVEVAVGKHSLYLSFLFSFFLSVSFFCFILLCFFPSWPRYAGVISLHRWAPVLGVLRPVFPTGFSGQVYLSCSPRVERRGRGHSR